MNKVYCLVALILALGGCAATQKYWQTIGGSRSDGVVTLSFEYHIFEKVQIGDGSYTAASSCRNWGYSGAQAFSGATQQCVSYDGSGSCLRYRVTQQYQCVGSPGE